MSRDILIIPTYQRSELLWLCLEHVAACPEARELSIRICVDQHRERPAPPPLLNEIGEIIAKLPALSIGIALREPHEFPGNSFNILTAYTEAYQSEAEFVFMVEDDVLVAPDFFGWHRAAQRKLPELFCSIGVRAPEARGSNPTTIFVNDRYASLGVCFRRQQLASIVPHAAREYFADQELYCRRHVFFPGAVNEDYEQDGLIYRIMRQSGRHAAWPEVPRAQHFGWYGYHRPHGKRPSGTLESRYLQAKAVIRDPRELRNCAKDFADIEPYALGQA